MPDDFVSVLGWRRGSCSRVDIIPVRAIWRLTRTAGDVAWGDQDMKAALHSWMADAQLRVIQDYVRHDRHLEHTPEETLAGDWVELMRAWAAAPEMGQDPRRRDIESEYSLRGLQPPYELVRAEMDALARGAAALIQQMDEVAGEEIDTIILDRRSHEGSRTN